MKNGNEQLEQLLRQFMDDEHARDLKEDLSYADRLFAGHPVPAVRQRTLSSIQVTIRRQLKYRRFLVATKWFTAAAAILIAVLLSAEHFINTENVDQPSFVKLYDTGDLWSDALYVVNSQDDPIERELSEVAESLRAVSLETYEPIDTFSIDMMELEEIESMTEKVALGKDNFYDI